MQPLIFDVEVASKVRCSRFPNLGKAGALLILLAQYVPTDSDGFC